ncbi:MAG: helix-turn-helix domain-containing protein [Verrucomicrobiales bacterium]|nr:helix-turn-helix domain-containing protein [Verrucomicrobiales bacterium]
MTTDDSILFRSGDPNFMTSLARGLEVLQAFSGQTRTLKMAAISEVTGLSRAVVRRCLYTLSEMGYVRQSTDGYQIEPKVLALSQTYFSSSSLPKVAQPFLDEIRETLGESCSLAVLDGSQVVYIARSAAKRIMTVSLGIGSRLPAYCTSLGRVILAGLERDALEELLGKMERKRHTEHTVIAIRELKQRIARVATDGYALVDQELEIGLRSLAVPVRSQQGKVVAAINVGVQATRISQRDMRSQMLPALQSAAQQVGQRLPE